MEQSSLSLSLPGGADVATDESVVALQKEYERLVSEPEALKELVLQTLGSVVGGQLSVATVVKIWQDAKLSEFEAASSTLADALWFSGSQVRPLPPPSAAASTPGFDQD